MSDRDDDDFDALDLDDDSEEEGAHGGEGPPDFGDDLISNDQPRPRGKTVPPDPAISAAKRLTAAEKQLRVATVANMLVNGYKRRDVHSYINEKLAAAWNSPSERAIDRLIANATVIIQGEAETDVRLEKGKAKARLDDLYRRSVGAKMFGTAARVQRQINRMLGLDEPIALRHGNDPTNPMPAPTGGTFVVLVQEVEET